MSQMRAREPGAPHLLHKSQLYCPTFSTDKELSLWAHASLQCQLLSEMRRKFASIAATIITCLTFHELPKLQKDSFLQPISSAPIAARSYTLLSPVSFGDSSLPPPWLLWPLYVSAFSLSCFFRDPVARCRGKSPRSPGLWLSNQ